MYFIVTYYPYGDLIKMGNHGSTTTRAPPQARQDILTQIGYENVIEQSHDNVIEHVGKTNWYLFLLLIVAVLVIVIMLIRYLNKSINKKIERRAQAMALSVRRMAPAEVV